MAEAAPSCRLYLTLPTQTSPAVEKFLAEVIEASDVACVLLCRNTAGADPASDLRLRELTLARDVALLVENDAAHAERIGADGVHLPADAALYGQARQHLGQRAIIGVGCNESRHDAMVLAELGADYVAFGPTAAASGRERDERAELIAWWSEIFVVPSVAWNVETLREATILARLGADFVSLAPSVWQIEDPAIQIAKIGASLREPRSAA